MQIDPVVAVMDEIERAYRSMTRARDKSDWDAARGELARISMLQKTLRRTTPSSVIGAAMLLREAASVLPAGAGFDLAARVRQVADRFDQGIRRVEDLKWLRELVVTLAGKDGGDHGELAAELILLSLKGASRPILLWRSMAQAQPDRMASPRASLWLAN